MFEIRSLALIQIDFFYRSFGAYGDFMALTLIAFVIIFLRMESSDLDDFSTISTIESHLSSIVGKFGFFFLSERRDVDKVVISSSHWWRGEWKSDKMGKKIVWGARGKRNYPTALVSHIFISSQITFLKNFFHLLRCFSLWQYLDRTHVLFCSVFLGS